MKRKKAVYKGLQFLPIYFEDTTLTSPEYFQITDFPNRLTAGKNLFKLRGHPTNLKIGGVLAVEVLDYNGEPIYHEVVNYIDEDKSRVISIYIYEETPPGDCTITLITEASSIQGVPTPIDQQGKPNVRWSRTVPVNPTIDNISEIIFETLPNINISEQVGVQLNRTYTNNEQFPTYNTGTVRYYLSNNQPAIEVTGGELTAKMQGGTFNVPTPVNPTPTPTFPIPTTAFTTTIKKVLNTGSALLDTEYTVFNSQSISNHTYNLFTDSSYTIDYEESPVYTATENSQSFAFIELTKLQPSTGDISRIKVFTSNNGTPGTYELVNDFELDETEIFIESTSSLFPDETIGLFTSQSLIDFWETNTFLNGTQHGTSPTLIYNTSSLANACVITSTTDISATNDIHIFKVKDSYSAKFIKNSEYKLRFDAIGTRSTNSGNLNPKLVFYMSGSSFDIDTTDTLNNALTVDIGKKIGEIEISTTNQRFDDQEYNFEADVSGNGVLYFIIKSGDWQIADVHVTSDNDPGYTPNYTRIKTPLEIQHKINNQINFKVEYYNTNGVKSKQTSYVYNKNWEGGNRYIDGDYSMLTGSLYVADSLNSGVAISGYPDAGFIRSLGYEGFDSGFPGFLIWSGSALPGQNSKYGNPYAGVGLELYANTGSYFRYSTSDDELDIRTTKFYLGHPSGSFISGSNGLLEISSSNYHITPEGNITASSAIFKDPTGTVLFDTNNKYVDGLNVGRVVYFDKAETSLNIANIKGSSNADTGSVFQTFLLPGETNIQMSCTYEAAVATADVLQINCRGHIESASLGPSTSPNIYGAFEDTSALNTENVSTTISAGNTQTGAVNVTIGEGQAVVDRGGMYVQIFVTFYITSVGSPTGTLKLKNFVFRTSRVTGGTLVPVTFGGPVS